MQVVVGCRQHGGSAGGRWLNARSHLGQEAVGNVVQVLGRCHQLVVLDDVLFSQVVESVVAHHAQVERRLVVAGIVGIVVDELLHPLAGGKVVVEIRLARSQCLGGLFQLFGIGRIVVELVS